VKDIRKRIGRMIWDAREEAAYSEEEYVFLGRNNCLVQ
jgi:hypothetical protein